MLQKKKSNSNVCIFITQQPIIILKSNSELFTYNEKIYLTRPNGHKQIQIYEFFYILLFLFKYKNIL